MRTHTDHSVCAGKSLVGEYLRHLPLQSRKPCIIAIKRDPLAAPFDSERCEPGVGDPGSSRFRLDAKSPEDFPVPFSRLYDLAMGLLK